MTLPNISPQKTPPKRSRKSPESPHLPQWWSTFRHHFWLRRWTTYALCMGMAALAAGLPATGLWGLTGGTVTLGVYLLSLIGAAWWTYPSDGLLAQYVDRQCRGKDLFQTLYELAHKAPHHPILPLLRQQAERWQTEVFRALPTIHLPPPLWALPFLGGGVFLWLWWTPTETGSSIPVVQVLPFQATLPSGPSSSTPERPRSEVSPSPNKAFPKSQLPTPLSEQERIALEQLLKLAAIQTWLRQRTSPSLAKRQSLQRLASILRHKKLQSLLPPHWRSLSQEALQDIAQKLTKFSESPSSQQTASQSPSQGGTPSAQPTSGASSTGQAAPPYREGRQGRDSPSASQNQLPQAGQVPPEYRQALKYYFRLLQLRRSMPPR